MSAVRLRRLQADFHKVREYTSRHPRVQLIQTDGAPPERYQLQYQIRSLRQQDDQLLEAASHLVEIFLPLNYPRLPPQCRMLTPIFHPNIAPHAICIGDHWSAGEPLASIVTRIGEMIAYQSYNTKSPLNGEAARWVSENLDRLPLDPVNMIVDEAGPSAAPLPNGSGFIPPLPAGRGSGTIQPPAAAAPAPPQQTPAPSPPQALLFRCPGCTGQLRVAPQHLGKTVRCPRCQTMMAIPNA